MASDNHGDKTQEEPQVQEGLGQQQTAQEQPQVSGIDWEKAVAEREEKIAALEAQVAEAAKNAEAAEQLRGEIAELKAQVEQEEPDRAVPEGQPGRSVRYHLPDQADLFLLEILGVLARGADLRDAVERQAAGRLVEREPGAEYGPERIRAGPEGRETEEGREEEGGQGA